jgi:hypothetical protein
MWSLERATRIESEERSGRGSWGFVARTKDHRVASFTLLGPFAQQVVDHGRTNIERCETRNGAVQQMHKQHEHMV